MLFWWIVVVVVVTLSVVEVRGRESKCASLYLLGIFVLLLLALSVYIEKRHTALILLLGVSRLLMIPALRRNFAAVQCVTQCKALTIGHSFGLERFPGAEGR